MQNKNTNDNKRKVEHKSHQRSQTNAQSEALRFCIRNCTLGVQKLTLLYHPLRWALKRLIPPRIAENNPHAGDQACCVNQKFN